MNINNEVKDKLRMLIKQTNDLINDLEKVKRNYLNSINPANKELYNCLVKDAINIEKALINLRLISLINSEAIKQLIDDENGR